MIHVGSLSNQSLGELRVEGVCSQHVHQDRIAVLVFLIDVRVILQDQLVQTFIVAFLGSEHDGSQALTILDHDVVSWLDLLADERNDLFLLVADCQEDRRSVLFPV